MASRVGKRILPCLDAMEPERPVPALTRDIHEQIFLRVASPADLARASAACVAFHRLITDPAFLHRHRSIHPPLLLGSISSAALHPAEPPHPSAAVAAAVARTADFTYDYIPRPTGLYHWYPRDVRNGHVLVDCRSLTDCGDGKERLCLDFAISDPVSRQYLLLPPMTDDLLASVGLQNHDLFNFGASFVPSRDMEDKTPFGVMCWMHSETKLVVFFFSSDSSHWTIGTSITWDDLGITRDDLGLERKVDSLGSCQCAYGCFYWKINYITKLLKLDMSTMELSTYDLPPDHKFGDTIIVESGEDRVAMFSQLSSAAPVGYYNRLQNGTEKSHEWHMKTSIQLPAQYTSEIYISGPAEGYIFLAGVSKDKDELHEAFLSCD